MSKSETTGYISFNDAMTDTHVPTLVATADEISEDRRKWVKGQAGNTLLFRAAVAFNSFLALPFRRPGSLNEAISLRNNAAKFFMDDEQFDEQARKVAEAFRPGTALVTIIEDNEDEPDTPEFVSENEEELDKREADTEVMREKNFPQIQGFLNGAKYDPIDIHNTEWMADRARTIATAAFSAMHERCHNDVLYNGGKWKDAKKARNQQKMTYHHAEGFLALSDRKLVEAAMKQGHYEIDS